jgi:hypothetical protein
MLQWTGSVIIALDAPALDVKASAPQAYVQRNMPSTTRAALAA